MQEATNLSALCNAFMTNYRCACMPLKSSDSNYPKKNLLTVTALKKSMLTVTKHAVVLFLEGTGH